MAKSSHAIKVGDKISIRTHARLKKVRVLDVPSTRQTSRKDASTLVEILSDEVLEENEL